MHVSGACEPIGLTWEGDMQAATWKSRVSERTGSCSRNGTHTERTADRHGQAGQAGGRHTATQQQDGTGASGNGTEPRTTKDAFNYRLQNLVHAQGINCWHRPALTRPA